MQMFAPVRRLQGNLSTRIAEQIQDLIARRRLKEGDRLPSEAELARLLRVSRPSLREALKTLAAVGLLEIRHGQGTFVTDGNVARALDRATSAWFEGSGTGRYLLEMRQLLEPPAAAWAAERATPEERAALAEIVSRMRAVRPDDPDLVETLQRLDTELHHRIAETTHNPVLVRMMRSLLDLLSESRKRSLRIPGQGLKSVRFHSAIARAIARQDPRGAARAMREHLEDVLRAVTRPPVASAKTRASAPG
jgi:GntR family transcriptional repressor for pyruvate dehydrogenase complex